MIDNDSGIFGRLQTLFAQALALPIEQRDQYLQQKCGRDEHLRARLERLIQVESKITHSLELKCLAASDFKEQHASSQPVIPRRIGKYRIRRVIAVGGMGTVYEAEQESPRRTVAVKAIRHEIVSPNALRRFDYESQLLASLRHPGIAQVHEAGVDTSSDTTIPYFAMEYIENGQPITQFSWNHKHDIDERLGLFTQVCDAVAHGHQRGVIHRDLKPSNILVDNDGHPRVIDFGVARATDSDLAQTTIRTETGQLIGTLQYMSPEQCAGRVDEIDTRSDVYALGVVLFELLSGQLPYSVDGQSIYESVRMVHETKPRRLQTLVPSIPRDVGTMVAKALEKDPERRYRSAAELGDDIQRYVNGDAILAQPPSVAYQLRIFSRRKRTAFIGICAVLVAMALGSIVSTVMYFKSEHARIQAAAERDFATRAQEQTRAVAEFLRETFKAVDPTLVGDSISVSDLLDNAIQRIDLGAFENQPLVEAAIRETVGEAYGDLIMMTQAITQLEIALDIRKRHQGPEHPDTLSTSDLLIQEYFKHGRNRDSKTLAQETFDIRIRVLGEVHIDTIKSMRSFAAAINRLGKHSEAEDLLRKALAICNREYGVDDTVTVDTLRSLGWMLKSKGNYVEAIPMLRRVVQFQKRALGETHPTTLFSMDRLAFTLREYASGNASALSDELEEAEKLARRILAVGEKQHHHLPDHFWGAARYTLASVLRLQGNLGQAEIKFQEIIERTRKTRGPEHPTIAGVMVELALIQRDMRNFDGALQALRESLRIRRQTNGNEHFYVGSIQYLIGQTLNMQGQYEDAETALLESYDILKRAFGAENSKTRQTVHELIRLHDLQKNFDQAKHWRDMLEGNRQSTASERAT